MKSLRELLSNPIPWIAAACIALIALAIWLSVMDSREWSEFSAAHDCKVVGKTSATVSQGMGMTPEGKMGVVFTTTPGKTGYACNDGVTYWR